jgi:hypothetical protein
LPPENNMVKGSVVFQFVVTNRQHQKRHSVPSKEGYVFFMSNIAIGVGYSTDLKGRLSGGFGGYDSAASVYRFILFFLSIISDAAAIAISATRMGISV